MLTEPHHNYFTGENLSQDPINGIYAAEQTRFSRLHSPAFML